MDSGRTFTGKHVIRAGFFKVIGVFATSPLHHEAKHDGDYDGDHSDTTDNTTNNRADRSGLRGYDGGCSRGRYLGRDRHSGTGTGITCRRGNGDIVEDILISFVRPSHRDVDRVNAVLQLRCLEVQERRRIIVWCLSARCCVKR